MPLASQVPSETRLKEQSLPSQIRPIQALLIREGGLCSRSCGLNRQAKSFVS
ncbi:hypothetical protein ACKFKG_03895 [Phormidesmis sp. 146-35]